VVVERALVALWAEQGWAWGLAEDLVLEAAQAGVAPDQELDRALRESETGLDGVRG